jgi:hypothetical protein
MSILNISTGTEFNFGSSSILIITKYLKSTINVEDEEHKEEDDFAVTVIDEC